MIAERESRDSVSRIRELDSLGTRITDSVASETSVAIEWLDCGTRTGGHVCHLSRTLGRWGLAPIMIGTFGTPMESEFESSFAEYTTYSIGEPGTTDAVEFDDGKLLLTEAGDYRDLDWKSLDERLGHNQLARLLEQADLFGMGYWSMIPALSEILYGLAEDVWPTLSDPPAHVVFDPADIRHLPDSRLVDGFDALQTLNRQVPVTLSANRGETEALIRSGGGSVTGDSMLDLATAARDILGVDRVVSHGARASAMAGEDDHALVETLHIEEPEIVTSSGDHFNAGVCLGLLEGFDAGATIALGNAVAGAFIRSGRSPTLPEVQTFLEEYGAQV
nr:PfkB family carbohydrate kinase [Halobellus ruber]